MYRPLTLAALVAAALPAQAEPVFVPAPSFTETSQFSGQRGHVARELRRFGFRDVDVTTLSNAQVSTIAALVHSSRDRNHIRAAVRGVLGRGVFARVLNR